MGLGRMLKWRDRRSIPNINKLSEIVGLKLKDEHQNV